ncbi:MAG: hypothetical protein JKX68_13425 [Flavobacteriales bacterium]|nr:hypothetical protein [Flavobacteriales bacterium]
MKNEKILAKASFTEQNSVKILKMKGTPYEMGYQHGYLLADKISVMINTTIQATIAFISLATGNDLNTSEERFNKGQADAEPFLPEEFKLEMEGICAGCNDAGIPVTLQQILLWNTNYDQWCIYGHPHYWHPTEGVGERQLAHDFKGAGGCSSFSAWDGAVGGDGNMIFCKDEDNFNMPGQLENRTMFIADPDEGYGHMFLSYPGMIGLDGGFNNAGFEMMTQLNSMKDESMKGCGIGIFTRLLLTHVNTVEGAIEIFNEYPRCAGIAYHVADSINKKAAIVETSTTQVAVRYPIVGQNYLYQANNSNCYPGWLGYEGYNMVNDQKLVNELSDVSTIEAWQASLRDPNNKYVQAPSRVERYGELMKQHDGNITVQIAQEIMSDRYDPYTQKTRGKWETSVSNNILCTICALYPDDTFTANPPLGEFSAHIANMWSLFAYPKGEDFWLAINDFPAEYGGYVQFNLNELLNSSVAYTVQANIKWQDTGITINRGDHVTIIYTEGEWTANPATGFVDANGNSNLKAKSGYTLPGANEGALCGKIGAEGDVFLIGNAKEIPEGSLGNLFLCINDDLNGEYGPGFADNEGAVTVSIDVGTE